MEEINALLDQFNHFKDARILGARKPDDSTVEIFIVIEDEDGEETNRFKVQLNGVKTHRLLDNGVLAFLDMMSGISIIKEHDQYAFALGSCDTMLCVHNAPMHVIAESVTLTEENR